MSAGIVIDSQEKLDAITEIQVDVSAEITVALKLKATLVVFGRLVISAGLDCSMGYSVEARGSSRVEARGSSRVEAWESSRVVARESSRVVAWGSSSVVAWGSSRVEARESSRVVAWGSSRVEARESSRVEARESSRVVAWGSSSVEARGSSRVEARESSRVEARESSRVVAWGSSRVVAWGSSSVVAWGSSRVEARESSRVEARESSRVEARESSRVVAWGSSSVVAWGSSRVEAWGEVALRLLSDCVVASLHGFCTAFIPKGLKAKVKLTARAKIQRTFALGWFDANAVKKTKRVIVFKRVSADFKTQEGTPNETAWTPGTTVTHPAWDPTSGECGGGKFHACSRPYFCDEFRSNDGDQYVAIGVALKDLHPWKEPAYPHKISFREGKVLYCVDRFGEKIGAMGDAEASRP